MFKKKEPTEQELVAEMHKVGISTKGANGRQEKFGAFKQYAQERQNMKPGFSPVNPYANMDNGQGGNPYAQAGDAAAGNPYGSDGAGGQGAQGSQGNQGSNPYGASRQSNPYGGNSARQGSPYSTESSRNGTGANPYGSASDRRPPNSTRGSGGHYGASTGATAGAAAATSNPYAGRSRQTRDDELTLDLNAISSNQPAVPLKKPIQRARMDHDANSLDLNEEDDLNVEVDDFLPEQEQVNSEDEEIEAIKQDIRFTKQESVALTRNTLRMAQEADASGTNTLGMLGSQSERLFNAEQNLLLADTQTKIADDKVSELKRLNRSIFIPATGNPFNKKLRLRQQEAKIKTQKEQEKYLRETNRQGMYASEQRVKQGITSNATQSDTYNRYQGEKYLQQAQRYQFENDSEDDEMEKELASNLDQISAYSKKLKSTALTMTQEVDAQNERLRKIEEDADRLDINVHLNSTRLSNIR